MDKWNWEHDDWPQFRYDSDALKQQTDLFISRNTYLQGLATAIRSEQARDITLQQLFEEGMETSRIEGEFLNQESLQSSIMNRLERTHYHVPSRDRRELGVADFMVSLHQEKERPISHILMFEWHDYLVSHDARLHCVGCYRNSPSPMLIVSGPEPGKVIYEALPASRVHAEMDALLEKHFALLQDARVGVLEHAALIHHWFLAIHPFEDGNGRIGRGLVHKILHLYTKESRFFGLSRCISKNKRAYYDALGRHNRTNDIDGWMQYFAQLLVDAQEYSIRLIEFTINVGHLFRAHEESLNDRQQQVLQRMLREGVEGFEGGMSNKKYCAICDTSEATAKRDLNSLVEMGILTRTGERKSTRYWLNIDNKM